MCESGDEVTPRYFNCGARAEMTMRRTRTTPRPGMTQGLMMTFIRPGSPR